jgi:hypothetical protein
VSVKDDNVTDPALLLATVMVYPSLAPAATLLASAALLIVKGTEPNGENVTTDEKVVAAPAARLTLHERPSELSS